MKLIRHVLIAVSIFLTLNLYSQENIPVGTWRTHLSYNHVIDITLGNNKVYSATENALFVYDKSDQSIQTITKLDGLSGGEISAIGYSDSQTSLIIAYSDGNIDIIKANLISSISDIKTDNFTSEKRINNIFIQGDLAYLSADFGISIIDLQNSQIKETIVNLGPDKINEVTIYNDSIFAATTQGILATTLDPSSNILDFNNWTTFSESTNEIISISVADNSLFAAEKEGVLYKYNNGQWVEENVLQGESFTNIKPSKKGLLIVTNNGNWNYTDGVITPITSNLSSVTNEILQDNDGSLWFADQLNGLVKLAATNTSERILASGPFSDNSFHTEYLQNKTFVLSGGIGENDVALNRTTGFYKLEKGSWDSFNEKGNNMLTPQARDLNDITYNPVSKQFVLSSFQDGLLIINADQSSLVIDAATVGNSLLSNRISGVAYANNGLWILNYGESRSIHHWGDDNVWNSFVLNNSATKFPLDIFVANNNDKWLRLSSSTGGGVYVFNEESGKQRLLNNIPNNGTLPSSEVHSLTEDLDGRIWLGTSSGVAYFNNSSSIDVSNGINATIPKIVVGRNIVPVLRDEKVLSIAVDWGNRKWLGTENGVWLFDEDAEREISHFNVKNSPLPSNKILSIGINSNNGEVFFATDQGLVSYRGTATISEAVHQPIKIFPNPITKDFNGLVSISGLVDDAIVKITDVSGKLIYQTQSNGGAATWNVQDYRGNRAVTGVYLVFSATEDGEDSMVGKLAVVN